MIIGADVTIYYLCLHMCDKEFIATMVSSVLSYAVSPFYPRRRSSQQHIIRQRVSDVPRFPGCSKLLTNSRGASERRRSGRCDNRRSIVRQSNTTLPRFVCESH